MYQDAIRNPSDRRNRIQPFHIQRLRGRRRTARRVEDAVVAMHSDRYPPAVFFVSLMIMTLCFADAFNTLQLLHAGGRELNPLMDVLLARDVRLFVLVKFLLTGLGVFALLGYLHMPRRYRRAVRSLLYGVLAFYLLLIGYQSLLMKQAGGLFGIVLPL